MEFTARLRYVRITPRKMGLIADEVRGKKLDGALSFLKFSARKRVATLVAECIRSAVAQADKKGTVDLDNLVISRILVGPGPILKRFRPRAKGSAFRINKKTSHLTVTLAER